ncbi:G8 domain-containing protein [Altererythrobacter sp. KTW20L]|uniref:G8 domain-containing protein n=1 Tax=Altererythrobacter sp. KTW20L TaxID=2942210 RepID=UPI0020C057D0|nr:G8 domain-containing protein [Altererythrobacter sp. KTW20L]MCL6251551.1 G8 domain-containing protein [Altererythrobacter sp. KTW20L]
MRKHPNLFLFASLLPATLLLANGSGAAAQAGHDHAMEAAEAPLSAVTRTVRWSDPAAWPEGRVPAAGDAVTIPRGTEVLLDVSPPELRSLTVDGRLRFADESDLELATDWIYLRRGELLIGSEDRPHTHKATITLTDNVPGEDINTMGDRGIMLMGGTLSLHGDRDHAWSKLAATAEAGATRIEVLDASGWRVGDEIVLASTDFDPRQAEKRTITAVSGNAITLDRPLEYMHFGEITFEVDQRGEVGLLTRNIRIQASEDADETYFGGHIMAMPGSKVQVSGIELSRMGQHLTLARYPIHWHLVGDGQGQYIKNSAIHDTYNRCVTVHGTNDLLIQNNVTYNTVGHCFFLEDGIETGNEFIRNLAIQTKCHPTLDCVPFNIAPNGEVKQYENRQALIQASFHSENVLLPSDNTVASFWITNPDNSYIDNVAAGSDQAGFWLSLPEHPNGEFLGTPISLQTWPRRTLMREFRGNIAHSNYDGFMFDRNIAEDNTFALAGNTYLPLKDPSDPSSEALVTYFDDLVAYKNRNQGLWGRGELLLFRNLKSADNAIGVTISSGSFGTETYTSLVTDSLFVGETDNVGNPRTPEEIAYGRSLPKPLIPDYPIRGYEYYDYRNEVENTTFVNYQDNDLRKTGALSWLMYNSSGVTTASTIRTATYIDAKPVYFPEIDWRFDNDNRGGNSWRTLSILDLDGTTSGIPMSHINLHDGENNSVVTDDTCVIQPDWNASVCAGDVGRLSFAPRSGFSPGRPGTSGRGPGGGSGILAALSNPPPPQAPITLFRNGTEFQVAGSQSNVRAGTELQVRTERPEVTLSLAEMDQGSWVVFELPGFANAASGTEQRSLDALRQANETSYFKGRDALWVKLVVAEPPIMPVRPLDIQASIALSR